MMVDSITSPNVRDTRRLKLTLPGKIVDVGNDNVTIEIGLSPGQIFHDDFMKYLQRSFGEEGRDEISERLYDIIDCEIVRKMVVVRGA